MARRIVFPLNPASIAAYRRERVTAHRAHPPQAGADAGTMPPGFANVVHRLFFVLGPGRNRVAAAATQMRYATVRLDDFRLPGSLRSPESQPIEPSGCNRSPFPNQCGEILDPGGSVLGFINARTTAVIRCSRLGKEFVSFLISELSGADPLMVESP